MLQGFLGPKSCSVFMLKSPFSTLKSRSLFAEGASVVHAKANSVVHADDDDDAYACNEVKQRVWLVNPTLSFPSPAPPPEVEVWW